MPLFLTDRCSWCLCFFGDGCMQAVPHGSPAPVAEAPRLRPCQRLQWPCRTMHSSHALFTFSMQSMHSMWFMPAGSAWGYASPCASAHASGSSGGAGLWYMRYPPFPCFRLVIHACRQCLRPGFCQPPLQRPCQRLQGQPTRTESYTNHHDESKVDVENWGYAT